MYNFNATRRTKLHQAPEDVLKEFTEISYAALDFEDDLLTKQLEKIIKMKLEAVCEDKKKEIPYVEDDEELEIDKQKLMIKELRVFVREGFVGEDSQSSGHKIR